MRLGQLGRAGSRTLIRSRQGLVDYKTLELVPLESYSIRPLGFLPLLKELEEFLSTQNNLVKTSWFFHRLLSVYIRSGAYHGLSSRTIDIASISVSPKHRRRGHCKRFIWLVQQLAGDRSVFIENVLDDNLRDYLVRNSWKSKGDSFYKEGVGERERC